MVLDAPIVVDEPGMQQAWRPKEDTDRFDGLRAPARGDGAVDNLVSVRLIRDIGPEYTWNFVQRFGFDKSQLPQDLTMALGTAEFSPLQMATAYSTFANGGFKVNSYYIDRILDAGGKALFQAESLLACPECGHAGDPPPPRRGPNGAAASEARRAARAARDSQLDEACDDGKIVHSRKGFGTADHQPQIAYLLRT